MGLNSEQAKIARAKIPLVPGRCQAQDTDGERCRSTWEACLPQKRFCPRCQDRLAKQRFRDNHRIVLAPY